MKPSRKGKWLSKWTCLILIRADLYNIGVLEPIHAATSLLRVVSQRNRIQRSMSNTSCMPLVFVLFFVGFFGSIWSIMRSISTVLRFLHDFLVSKNAMEERLPWQFGFPSLWLSIPLISLSVQSSQLQASRHEEASADISQELTQICLIINTQTVILKYMT